MAVLTSQATLPTLGVAVNRTLGHRLERVVFLTGSRGRRAPPGMTVVTLGEERPIGHLHLALRHLLEQHGDDFDWFFLVPDATYTEAHGLARLAGRLSLAAAAHLYLGLPQDFIGGEPAPGRYCHGGLGCCCPAHFFSSCAPTWKAAATTSSVRVLMSGWAAASWMLPEWAAQATTRWEKKQPHCCLLSELVHVL